MLVANLLPKVVPHSGSRLLPRFIVRIRARLVASKPPLDPAPTRSPRPSRRLGGPHPGHPRPVAALSQREGLLALRFLSPASLLPETVLPEPVQPQGTGPEARAARVAEGVGQGSLRPFGRLPRDGHDPHIPAIVRVRASRKGLFCGQATFGGSASKTEWIYGFKVALVVDPDGVVTVFGLAAASSEERPIGEALVARDLPRGLPGGQRVHGGAVGASLAGGLRGYSGRHPVGGLSPGMAEEGSPVG
jgi:hypothetical protein